jgi:hypothetical protein
MGFVIDYEQLSGTQNETIVKELSIAGENVLETFQFESIAIRPHGDTEKRSNLGRYGHIPYNKLS